MERREFLDAVVKAIEPDMPRSLASVVRHAADMVYDPLLDDNNEKQFQYAARMFESYGDGFYRLSETLRKIGRSNL